MDHYGPKRGIPKENARHAEHDRARRLFERARD
jgi:hypothetical protein